MSTANVARDMDRLRQAVGDQKLTYYGVSYGTFLGQTYANMFPNNFRALVIDGVLDPIAWTTGAPGEQSLPFSSRLRSDIGARDTLAEFFRLCDAGGDACPLSSGAGAEARYAALAERLRAGPIQIQDPSTGMVFPYNYSFFIGDTLGTLYNSFGWPDFALFLSFLETQASPAVLGHALAAVRGTSALTRSSDELSRATTGYIVRRGFPHYPNFVEGFPAVACADSDNPDSYDAWVAAGAAADATYGYFGRIWTWASSICAEWPGADSDRYMGPFNRETGNPVLVVGAKWDPATRYQGAVTAHDLLPNSALLTVNSWGHTSLFTSACADAAIAAYLISVTMPASGAVCNQDLVPWVDFGPGGPGGG
jgi:pimeloyl-ACP methyl ester carboxylesterase